MEILTDAIAAIIKAPFMLVFWVVIGVVAGDLARRFMGSRDQGCLSDWLLGILGGFAGGFLGGLLGVSLDVGLGIGSLITATVGAMVLIGLRRALTR